MKVTLKYSEKMHFSASARHFKEIHLDEPESFHGSDLAPSPIEYFLIGIGGCIGATFVFCLQKHNIILKNFKVIVDGTLKHIGPKMRLKLIKIDIELEVTLNENVSNKNLDLCYKTFQEHCPISDRLTLGIPLTLNMSKK